MKIAAIYNVFDGEELLCSSIASIRNAVDIVIAVSQVQSNFGEYNTAGFEKCERLVEQKLIDVHEKYNPLIDDHIASSGTKNEILKRNIGLRIARESGCTHFLFVDCDEFYEEQAFKVALSQFIDSGLEGSVVSIKNHFKFPQWAFVKLETFYVPFIHVLNEFIKVDNPNYPFRCDATRTVNVDKVLNINPKDCVMHHYGWIRNDIEKKMRNSSATSKLKLYLPFIRQDLLMAGPGYQLCKYFDHQKLEFEEPLFNVSLINIKSTSEQFKILVQFPTRARPERFFQTLDLYVKLLDNSTSVFFSIICDEDDELMNNATVRQRLEGYANLRVAFRVHTGKIDAVNSPFLWDDWDIVFLASDDMIPQIDGYDKIIRTNFFKYFPNTDGVLWFNDGHQEKRLNTLVIIGRVYYNRFNYLYHPSYKSLYCDKEFTYVANLFNKQVYFEQVIIKHVHPSIENDLTDSLYEVNNKFEKIDFDNFNERAKHMFDLFDVVEKQRQHLKRLKYLSLKIKIKKFFGLHIKP